MPEYMYVFQSTVNASGGDQMSGDYPLYHSTEGFHGNHKLKQWKVRQPKKWLS